MHFIAMEKVEGSNLRAALAGTRLPLRRAVDLVAQIAAAIAAAHSVGVVHRDLKPENIVLNQEGTPKVLDFGLAKLRPAEESGSVDSRTALLTTDSGVLLGTVGYMAPEQALGKPADHRSDIFSLGCILFETITGRRAFAASSSVETLHAIIHDEPPSLRQSNPSASPELQRIVSKAMAKNPDERYQSAKELVIDLRAALRDQQGPSDSIKRLLSRTLPVALLLVAAIIITVAVLKAFRSPGSAPLTALTPARLDVRRVTSRGTVTHAVISPDGKFLVYSLLDHSVRLRQLASGEELELVPSEGRAIWGLAFAPDGDSVLFVRKDKQNPVGSCYRVASIGGRPERLFDGIDSDPAVSPDGKRIAWLRAETPGRGDSALMVGNIDGSAARTIVTRRLPERLAPLYFSGPSWSSDGKSIVTTVQRDAEPIGSQLIVVDSESGSEEQLLDRNWALITQSAWLADHSGIVMVASPEEYDVTRMQLWLVPYPRGTPTRITSELSACRGVSATSRADLLATIALEITGRVWTVSLGSDGVSERVSTGRTDGWRGVALLPDGRIVFSSSEETGQTLVISNRDGGGRRKLTRDGYNNRFPTVTRDGIAYVSTTPDRTEVCITDFEGDSRRVIVGDVDSAPIAISPDGTQLVFRRNRRLWRMPVSGGTATELWNGLSSSAAFSPAGDRVAVLLGDPETYSAGVGVLSVKDGRLLWSGPLLSVHTGTTLRWMPDGSGLLVNGGPRDDRNLWLMPFEGQPRRVTDFNDQRAYFWDLSPDGKSAVIARANIARDAVVISGFR